MRLQVIIHTRNMADDLAQSIAKAASILDKQEKANSIISILVWNRLKNQYQIEIQDSEVDVGMTMANAYHTVVNTMGMIPMEDNDPIEQLFAREYDGKKGYKRFVAAFRKIQEADDNNEK